MTSRLRCSLDELNALAGRYAYGTPVTTVLANQNAIHGTGHLTRAQLHTVALWKSRRRADLVLNNAETFVMEVTAIALGATSERLRIGSLTLLDGVGWPTASVILHFYHPDDYPIIDFRALWTLGMAVPNQYAFDVWERYVNACRALVFEAQMDMRTLDKALWQYSLEHQPKK